VITAHEGPTCDRGKSDKFEEVSQIANARKIIIIGHHDFWHSAGRLEGGVSPR
jgi:hypothetical protein